MLESSQSSTPKSFWNRPEGKTGIVFSIAIIAALGYLLYIMLPTLIVLMQNLIYAIILFVVLGVIIYVLLDPKFRALMFFMYKSFMRWITGLFVQIDPIQILKSYVEYLYKNLSEMDKHIAKLKGQMAKLKSIIDNNKAEMEENLRMAEAAKKKNNMELVAINTRQFGRLKEANEKYTVLHTKMEVLYRVLSKIHKNSGYLIKDIENEVRMREQEAIAIRQGYSAMKRAMNIISGDPDKKMIFDMAMENIVDDVSMKIGEMERFMEISSTFIDSVDLQNAVYEQKGLELLEKMETDGVSFLLGDNPEKGNTSEKRSQYVEVEKPAGNETFTNYTDLFN